MEERQAATNETRTRTSNRLRRELRVAATLLRKRLTALLAEVYTLTPKQLERGVRFGLLSAPATSLVC